MSTLANYLEQEGLATTLIGLVRDHLERAQPPRALWTSFELGRPVGPPNNAAFQRRVLMAALNLLTRKEGPIICEDFLADDPNSQLDIKWTCGIDLPDFTGLSRADALLAEIAVVKTAYESSVIKQGKTAVGLTGMSIEETATYINSIANGIRPESPLDGYSPVLGFRFAADDIKAFYLEAACQSGNPNSRQLVEWFWDKTVAAQTIIDVRSRFLYSDSRSENVIGNLTLVPGAQIVRLGL